jgi:TonB-linked SusC/RagA family outer membrane protein
MINEGKSPVYSEEAIAKYKSGEDPDNFPNNRRYDKLIRSGSGVQTEHNVIFSGGIEQNRYSMSMGYLHQDGLIQKNTLERYTIRLNLDSKVGEKLDLSFKLQGKHTIKNEPFPTPTSLIFNALKLPPTVAGRKSDGTYDHVSGITLEGWLDSDSFDTEKQNYVFGSMELTYQILKDLTITGIAGYTNTDISDRTYSAEIILNDNAKISPSYLNSQRSNLAYLTLQSFLKYNKSFGEHRIDITGGYSQEEKNTEWDRTYRDNFPSNTLYQINAGSSQNMGSYGSGSGWALMSFFGRIDYSYRVKYLMQLNARYDGSSRFPKGNRFDLFSSVSEGWMISEEDFFDVAWIDNLKIRGSYGELGNQEVGLYPYQQTLNLGKVYPFGGQIYPGLAATTLPNKDLSWERTKVYDMGLDFVGWKGKLSVTSDFFIKRTEDILYKISSSTILGLTPSEQNAGIVDNRGFEIQVGYKNNIGELSYSITPNFSYVRNKVVSLFNVERDIAKGLFVGEPITSIYGYEAEGLFVDDEDIANYATQPYVAKPGYPRLKDLNGDGKVTPEMDRKVIGNLFPKYSFGSTISGSYKNLDFSIQLQGVAGIDNLLVGLESEPQEGLAFFKGSTPQQWMVDNRWTPENPDRNAKYPRWETTDQNHPECYTSTYWLRSAAFLRLNYLQIGYSLPAKALKMSKLRVYFSGSNLLTIDGYYEGWDPEMDRYYPPTAVYSIGLNASF